MIPSLVDNDDSEWKCKIKGETPESGCSDEVDLSLEAAAEDREECQIRLLFLFLLLPKLHVIWHSVIGQSPVAKRR